MTLLPPETVPVISPENVSLLPVALVQDPVTLGLLAVSCIVTALEAPSTVVEVPAQLPVREGLDGATGEAELEELPPQLTVAERTMAARTPAERRRALLSQELCRAVRGCVRRDITENRLFLGR